MGNGVEVLKHWAKGSFNLNQRRAFLVGLAVCLFFACFSGTYLHRTLTHTRLPMENKEMGLWMKENIPHIEDEYVASVQPSVSFYSGARILTLPYVDQLEDLLTYLDHHQAKYFVVSEDIHPIYLEAYGFLLDATSPSPPGIAVKHVVRGRNKMILYEVKEDARHL